MRFFSFIREQHNFFFSRSTGSQWGKNSITYRILQYSSDISQSETDDIIKEAFSKWENVSPLSFTLKSSGDVDMEIKFTNKDHDDGYPFDGKGKVLGHAFYPSYGGGIHFDDDEKFTVAYSDGTHLLQVATHEFGHALGLQHCKVDGALMNPFYRSNMSDVQLGPDDIAGIQTIYGKPTPSNNVNVLHHTVPWYCKQPFVDAVTTNMEHGKQVVYVFIRNAVVKLDENGVAKQYPKFIYQDWPGLPNKIDAALFLPARDDVEVMNGLRMGIRIPDRTYFFKGGACWSYENKKLQSGFPKSISDVFPGIPSDIDAAFVWSSNGDLYFIKGKISLQYITCRASLRD